MILLLFSVVSAADIVTPAPVKVDAATNAVGGEVAPVITQAERDALPRIPPVARPASTECQAAYTVAEASKAPCAGILVSQAQFDSLARAREAGQAQEAFIEKLWPQYVAQGTSLAAFERMADLDEAVRHLDATVKAGQHPQWQVWLVAGTVAAVAGAVGGFGAYELSRNVP